jgi:hypothetical protein
MELVVLWRPYGFYYQPERLNRFGMPSIIEPSLQMAATMSLATLQRLIVNLKNPVRQWIPVPDICHQCERPGLLDALWLLERTTTGQAPSSSIRAHPL